MTDLYAKAKKRMKGKGTGEFFMKDGVRYEKRYIGDERATEPDSLVEKSNLVREDEYVESELDKRFKRKKAPRGASIVGTDKTGYLIRLRSGKVFGPFPTKAHAKANVVAYGWDRIKTEAREEKWRSQKPPEQQQQIRESYQQFKENQINEQVSGHMLLNDVMPAHPDTGQKDMPMDQRQRNMQQRVKTTYGGGQ